MVAETIKWTLQSMVYSRYSLFAFPLSHRTLSSGCAKCRWVEWHCIYPITPTQTFVGDTIWRFLVSSNLSTNLPFCLQMSIIWIALSLSGVQVPRHAIYFNSWGPLFKILFRMNSSLGVPSMATLLGHPQLFEVWREDKASFLITPRFRPASWLKVLHQRS